MIASQVLRNYINLIYHDCSQNAYSCRIPISSLPAVKAPQPWVTTLTIAHRIRHGKDRKPEETLFRDDHISPHFQCNVRSFSYLCDAMEINAGSHFHDLLLVWHVSFDAGQAAGRDAGRGKSCKVASTTS